MGWGLDGKNHMGNAWGDSNVLYPDRRFYVFFKNSAKVHLKFVHFIVNVISKKNLFNSS